MKKAIYGLLLVAIGFIVVLIYQNMAFLRETHGFELDLIFVGKYLFPKVANGVYYIVFLVSGILIAYFFSLSERFRNRQTIKNLTMTIDSHRDVISSLEIELNAIRGRKPQTVSGTESAPTPQGAVQ